MLELSSLLAIRDGVAEASRRAPATRARRTRPKRRCWNPDKAAAWALACEARAGDGGFKEDGLWAFDSLNGNCAAAAQAYLGRTAADACLFQEMRVRTANCRRRSVQRLMAAGL